MRFARAPPRWTRLVVIAYVIFWRMRFGGPTSLREGHTNIHQYFFILRENYSILRWKSSLHRENVFFRTESAFLEKTYFRLLVDRRAEMPSGKRYAVDADRIDDCAGCGQQLLAILISLIRFRSGLPMRWDFCHLLLWKRTF